APSLAVFNGKLYLAWVADDPSDTLAVCSSADGTTWSAADDIGQQSQVGPSLAVFNGRLYVAFIGTQTSNRVLVCSSADGAIWPANVDSKQSSQFAPSLTAFDGQLFMSLVDANDVAWVGSSHDGISWPSFNNISSTIAGAALTSTRILKAAFIQRIRC